MQRFRRNLVKGLRNADGEWCEGDDQVAGLFVNFYKNLFTSSNLIQMAATLEAIPWVVTEEMNEKLLCNFSRIEVDLALKQTSPLKAPGPDGMPPIFYQHY